VLGLSVCTFGVAWGRSTPSVGWQGVETRSETIARSSACRAHSRPGSYNWPIKPFNEPHPVRGNFGDPRTNFVYGLQGGPLALGGFRFHNGIDISAPDGSAVYPVAAGQVINVAADHLVVSAGTGRRFQYWHIRPAVSPGQPVFTDRTILGSIIAGAGHVHLTEIDQHHVTNPLFPGHIFPYRDNTPPRVDTLEFRNPGGSELAGPILRGTISVTATTHDTPSLPPPGPWRSAVVTPALIRWWLSRPDGSLLLRSRTVFDVRNTLPPKSDFWRIYAPGTFQNFPVANSRRLMRTGNYDFYLGELRTSDLPDGKALLTVEAADACGNSGTLTTPIQIADSPTAEPFTSWRSRVLRSL